MPAAVNERKAATDLLEAGPAPRDLLADKGFNGKAFAAEITDRMDWPATARIPSGPPARTAATIAAHTLLLTCLAEA